jgi:hypothetical protein
MSTLLSSRRMRFVCWVFDGTVKYSRCDEFSPRVPRPASSPPPIGGGLSCVVRRAALHPRSTLPPPRRSGLRFSSPLGHGRGLASRPAAPVRRRHRFRQASSPPVQARRLAATFPVSPPPAFIHARRTVPPKCFCPFPGVNRCLHPSFTSFGRGSAMSAAYACACHRPSVYFGPK